MEGTTLPEVAPQVDALDHAGDAADHLLALVAAGSPDYRPTPARRDAMVTLLTSIVRTIALQHST